MSKLAAICARLSGAAESRTDITASDGRDEVGDDVSDMERVERSPPPPPPLTIRPSGAGRAEDPCNGPRSLNNSPYLAPAPPLQSAGDLGISGGLVDEEIDEDEEEMSSREMISPSPSGRGLKRRSLLPALSAGSSSRRKKHRPTSLHSSGGPVEGERTWESGVPAFPAASEDRGDDYNDDDSMDGLSEHSLHIDLPDDTQSDGSPHKTTSSKALTRSRKRPYNSYTSPSTNAADFARSNAVEEGSHGYGDKPSGNVPAPDFLSNILASQSLAVLAAQHAAASSSGQAKDGGNRVASPATSLSGDSSLNDSHSRSGLQSNAATATGVGVTTKGTSKASSSAGKAKPVEYVRYMKRYSNAGECNSSYCIGMNYREHYHCVDCKSKIFVKKEEMIRHYKWHKKRDDSLQHGFMRYSPYDDCSSKYGMCAHNRKQTHYHCVQSGCNKVYVSTSDVQMHANYHRKASAIFMEGFQRFRATEDCGTTTCDFYRQRTTHFHCRRNGCNFTFKNKADMEKHKTYHQKDEILSKDGFKKFMKYEHCPYPGCAYSKISNHIHCMRPNCQYVLHSTSQLYPHKRKHDKQDMDSRSKTRSATTAIAPGPSSQSPSSSATGNTIAGLLATGNAGNTSASTPAPTTATASNISNAVGAAISSSVNQTPASDLLSTVARLSQGILVPNIGDGDLLPTGILSSSDSNQSQPQSDVSNRNTNDKSQRTNGGILAPQAMNWKTERSSRLTDQAKSMMGHFKISGSSGSRDNSEVFAGKSFNGGSAGAQQDLWKKYLTRYTANDPCNARCHLLYKDHYHCNVENCFSAYKNKEGVREHARQHDNQERISEQLFSEVPADIVCPVESCEYSENVLHYHCTWSDCDTVIQKNDRVFSRLEHYQEHELKARMAMAQAKKTSLSSSSPSTSKPLSVSGKRRGRPPKMPVDRPSMSRLPRLAPSSGGISDDLAAVTSLRCDDNSPPLTTNDNSREYTVYDGEKTPCPDDTCVFREELHYHCNRPRCNSITNRLDVMTLHGQNFHQLVKIPKYYAYFDRNVNCRLPNCSNNQCSSHYHCLRPGCDQTFIRHTTLYLHERRHVEYDAAAKRSNQKEIGQSRAINQTNVVPKTEPNEQITPNVSPAPLLNPDAGLAEQLRRLAEVAMKNQSLGVSQTSFNSSVKEGRHSAGGESRSVNSSGVNRTVKATGTFFPQKGSATSDDNSSNHSSSTSDEEGDLPPVPTLPLAAAASQAGSVALDSQQAQQQASVMFGLLSQMWLLQQQQQQQQQTAKAADVSAVKQDDTWNKMLGRMYASPDVPCINVFCKKKRVEHYHCLECGTAFAKNNEAKLRTHISRHSKYRTPTESASSSTTSYSQSVRPSHSSADGASTSTSMQRSPTHRYSRLPVGMATAPVESSCDIQMAERAVADSSTADTRIGDSDGDSTDPGSPSSLMRDGEDKSASSAPAVQNMMMKALQLQMVPRDAEQCGSSSGIGSSDRKNDSNGSVPSGYVKFSSLQSCGYSRCSHSKTVTHYHCVRDECGFSVNDDSRLQQHTQRHDKLDRVMGDDFKLYRINTDCGRSDCEFSCKTAHFHCLLCPYICTDASRIIPHRKNHNLQSLSHLQTPDQSQSSDTSINNL